MNLGISSIVQFFSGVQPQLSFHFILGGEVARGSLGTQLGHVFVGTAMTERTSAAPDPFQKLLPAAVSHLRSYSTCQLPSHVNCVASNMCVACAKDVFNSLDAIAPPPNAQSHKNRNTFSNTMALRRACMHRVRNVMTTLVAGHLCFCLLLHASSRFSDSLRIEKLEVTTNAKICLVETVIRRHKTATTFEKKAKFPHGMHSHLFCWRLIGQRIGFCNLGASGRSSTQRSGVETGMYAKWASHGRSTGVNPKTANNKPQTTKNKNKQQTINNKVSCCPSKWADPNGVTNPEVVLENWI